MKLPKAVRAFVAPTFEPIELNKDNGEVKSFFEKIVKSVAKIASAPALGILPSGTFMILALDFLNNDDIKNFFFFLTLAFVFTSKVTMGYKSNRNKIENEESAGEF